MFSLEGTVRKEMKNKRKKDCDVGLKIMEEEERAA
jgi:hypothetical protein